MIRHILRDLFPTRAQVGALRAKTHEVTGHLVAVNAKCADQAATIEHLRNHIESLSAELAEVEAERDALAKRSPDPTPFVPEDGGECPDRTCTGTLRWTRVGDCSCHISPPCGSCTSSPLVCDECGWRTE